MNSAARITVIGVGNEYRRDDGVGWAVVGRLAERVEKHSSPGGATLVVCDGDPARLISHWDGADLAIVVDAAHAHPAQPGRVHRLELDGGRFVGSDSTTSSHGLGLGDAVELARELDRLPRLLIVYAVEGSDCSPGTGLSAPVQAAVGPLTEQIAERISEHRGSVSDRQDPPVSRRPFGPHRPSVGDRTALAEASGQVDSVNRRPCRGGVRTMEHRSVSNVMTHGVVTVRPDTPFKEIAELFERNGITAVPVVDDRDHPIGIVSEADLLRKQAHLPDPQGRTGSLLAQPRDTSRAEAETADGLMTSPALCAHPEWSIVEAARTMDREKIKRLPVVDEAGRTIGIVSRSDLLRLFLRHDSAIREEINRDILDRTLHLGPGAVRVTVQEGVVTLTGRVEQADLVPIIERLCSSVDGVVSVHQSIEYPLDDIATEHRVSGSVDSPAHHA